MINDSTKISNELAKAEFELFREVAFETPDNIFQKSIDR